ncbi:AI-2E family transporter [Corynebacterium breve]|uniref:AI-2E family transporter n=1 Tax=Corynebacterium breve TaxID=3049799 RepID=A0ABY8VLD9_9CORY|nr:AI-2E family transporter [Corynebacterium breve]WIM69004.1 AI-2E family transporter [Corynebacterium breve]
MPVDDELDDLAESFAAERPDQVDRSIVLNGWIKSLAMFALRLLIIAVFAYALWYVVKTLWAGILPVILAIIICTVLAPPTTWMRKIGIPSGLAALVSILIFFATVAFLVFLIAPDIASQSQFLYLQAFEGIQRLQLWAQGPPLNVDGSDLQQVIDEIAAWLQEQAGTIAGGIFSGIGTATSIVVTLGVVLVLTFFFLKDGYKFLPWLRSATGRRVGLHATELLTRAWNTLGGFIRAQAVVSLVDALFIGVGIAIVGVPMAFTLAVITFIAGFIPIVGAVVAGALAVLVALVSLGFTEAVIVLVIVLAVQQIEGNVLSPMLQSKAMNLHPVIVLVSVTIGGGMFGLIGSFLAVPVAAMIAVVFRYIQDMTAIHAGEKDADELAFSTEEGELVARISEEEAFHQREKWREKLGWVPTAIPEESASSSGSLNDDKLDDLTSSAQRQPRFTLSSPKIKRLFDQLRNRSK